MKSLYSSLAENIQFVFPQFYKERFFKKLKNLSKETTLQLNMEPELVWVTETLKKDDVVIEVGTNVGVYLYQISKVVHPRNIYAFEPNRKLYERLVRIFPEVHLFPMALSDENSISEFKVPVINGREIASRGTLKTTYVEQGESRQKTQKVKVIRLDDWDIIQHFDRLDFIKIDVEGNELHTLEGAKKTIQKFKPILMVEMEQRHHQEPLWKNISEIESWGYLAKYLDRETFTLKKVTENIILEQDERLVKNKNKYVNNILFIPKK